MDLTLKDGKIISFDGYLEEIKPKTGKEDQRVLEELEESKRVYDEWGNELGLDGALSEEMKIYVKLT